jgi:mRNA interferase RelE/StbE
MREKKWETELSKDARKYLEKLAKRSSLRILDELEELGKTENPTFHKDVRPLTGKLKGFYRLRIGDLRVIFEIDWTEKRIGILAIVPRGNAY